MSNIKHCSYKQVLKISPSNNINNEVPKTSIVDPLTITTQGSEFESSYSFTVLGGVDEAENEPINSFSLTRSGSSGRARKRIH